MFPDRVLELRKSASGFLFPVRSGATNLLAINGDIRLMEPGSRQVCASKWR